MSQQGSQSHNKRGEMEGEGGERDKEGGQWQEAKINCSKSRQALSDASFKKIGKHGRNLPSPEFNKIQIVLKSN